MESNPVSTIGLEEVTRLLEERTRERDGLREALGEARDYVKHVADQTLGTEHDLADIELLDDIEQALSNEGRR